MIAEDLDAAGAGYRVGYEDPSQFSRVQAPLRRAADPRRRRLRDAAAAMA